MSDIPETIRDRLLKIKALYERGATDHERSVAFHHLEKLLKQYNLTLADLEQRNEDYYAFAFTNAYERLLLIQLAGYIKNWHNAGVYYRDGKKRTSILLKLTAAEYADLKILYDYYRQAWAKALDDFYGAWLQAQGLTRPAESSDRELSEIEIAAILQRRRMMQSIEALPLPATQFLKAGD